MFNNGVCIYIIITNMTTLKKELKGLLQVQGCDYKQNLKDTARNKEQGTRDICE